MPWLRVSQGSFSSSGFRSSPRGNPRGLAHHWPSSGWPTLLRGVCQGYRSSRTCDSPCSPWSCGLYGVQYAISSWIRIRSWPTDHSPSCWQFLQTSGGLSGHSTAGCPSWLQMRQGPLKTRGLVQSALVCLIYVQRAKREANLAQVCYPSDLPFFAAVEARHALARLGTVTGKVTFVSAASTPRVSVSAWDISHGHCLDLLAALVVAILEVASAFLIEVAGGDIKVRSGVLVSSEGCRQVVSSSACYLRGDLAA